MCAFFSISFVWSACHFIFHFATSPPDDLQFYLPGKSFALSVRVRTIQARLQPRRRSRPPRPRGDPALHLPSHLARASRKITQARKTASFHRHIPRRFANLPQRFPTHDAYCIPIYFHFPAWHMRPAALLHIESRAPRTRCYLIVGRVGARHLARQ